MSELIVEEKSKVVAKGWFLLILPIHIDSTCIPGILIIHALMLRFLTAPHPWEDGCKTLIIHRYGTKALIGDHIFPGFLIPDVQGIAIFIIHRRSCIILSVSLWPAAILLPVQI